MPVSYTHLVGEITREKLDILRKSDAIYLEELENAGLARDIWQSFAVLTGSKTVGVMGDGRTYAYCVALRAVTSDDAMTVEAAELPYPVLKKCVSRIIKDVYKRQTSLRGMSPRSRRAIRCA